MPGYERTLARVRELLPKDADVLEIGCGTGTTALRLAPFLGSLIATDVSAEMIAIAREKAAQRAPNLSFSAAPADRLPGEDESFDAVLAFNLLHLVPDRRAVLNALRRRLKPGGLFISKTPCLAEMNPLIRAAVPVMRFFGKAPTVAIFDSVGLGDEIDAAGFSVIERARHGSGRKDARIFLVAQKD